jgi:hypothetical protein
MRNLKILKDIDSGLVKLDGYKFLEPIAIAHLAVSCKERNSLVDLNHCLGPAASFLSRLNFYDYVGLVDNFGCGIYAGNNKETIEVNDASNANDAVFDKVKVILAGESPDSLETIDRLLSELITNVEMYARFGVVVGQVINGDLHLAVVDRGPGIVTHLKASNSKFASMSDADVLKASLEKGVTSGRGMGFGLWQTREVLRRNRGTLLIRTENHIVDGISGRYCTANHSWFGTSIDIRYSLNRPVNFGKILILQNSIGVSNEFGF